MSLRSALAAMVERGITKMEEGDEVYLVFDDAVVYLAMQKRRNLKVKVVPGEPIRVREKFVWEDNKTEEE